MAPLADFLLSVLPVSLPSYLTSFIPGKTPLSTNTEVLTTLGLYLAVIFGIQAYKKNRQPQKLNTLFQAHNVILSSGSLLLLALMLEEILPIVWKNGLYFGICALEAWTPVSYSVSSSFSTWRRPTPTENGILLSSQLLLQISRIAGYSVFGVQEETAW